MRGASFRLYNDAGKAVSEYVMRDRFESIVTLRPALSNRISGRTKLHLGH